MCVSCLLHGECERELKKGKHRLGSATIGQRLWTHEQLVNLLKNGLDSVEGEIKYLN